MPKKIKSKIHFPPNYTVAKALLDILWEIGEATAPWGSPYKQIQKLHRKALGIPEPPRWKLNRALKYLEKLGHIKTADQNGELFVKLTKKGKLNALLKKLNAGALRPKTWDGKWRLIIWDIPESSHLQRDQLRYFCKNLGFYLLQKSVFITPHPLSPAAVIYLKESGLWQFIRLLRVDKIDDDQFLRKHFGLKILPKKVR